MDEVLIAPSLLSANFLHLGKEIQRIEKAKVNLIHIDIMDGHFVPNISMGPFVLKTIKSATNIPLDVHLMINNIDRYIEKFIEAGADWISFHREAARSSNMIISEIKRISKGKVKAGMAVRPKTSISVAKQFLEKLDFVLVMSVEPGFAEQEFIEESLEKIRNLKKLREQKNYNFLIEVDGGINKENAKRVVESGADILVSGAILRQNKIRKPLLGLDK